MDNQLFNRFAPIIQSLSVAELKGASTLFEKLALAEQGGMRVCYAPFEYVNRSARVVIVGITPGQTQMLNSLREAKRLLDRGLHGESVLKAAKSTGAFSGPMRANLTALLDAVGIQRLLGLSGSSDLFDSAAHLVQTTSVLRYPVFIKGKNYNGAPNMTKHPLLRENFMNYFAEDVALLPNAIFVPLGDKVAEALQFLARNGKLSKDRILDGLPHPSPLNGERIAYFLGGKTRTALSAKTNPDKLDEARISLRQRVLAQS